MLTLTEAAYYSRRFIRYGSIALVIYIILRIGFGIFTAWWKATHPAPPPPPKVTFGKLVPIPFPQQEKPTLTYKLETATGTTGEFGDRANVYLIPSQRGSLLALDRATDLARVLGFLFEPTRVGETTYIWTKDKPLPSTFKMDILTGHFRFEADWRVQPELLAEISPPTETEAVAEAREWLAQIGQLAGDLKAGETLVTYLKVSGTEIVPALAQSEAQLVRVDIFRGKIDELPVLPADPDKGMVSITLLPAKRTREAVVEVEYNYFPVDYEQSSDYPILPSQVAWERLQSGEAYFVRLPKGVDEVVVRKINLGYFDPPQAGVFLQPVYIFEGDAGFLTYVPAITDEWLLEEGEGQ